MAINPYQYFDSLTENIKLFFFILKISSIVGNLPEKSHSWTPLPDVGIETENKEKNDGSLIVFILSKIVLIWPVANGEFSL